MLYICPGLCSRALRSPDSPLVQAEPPTAPTLEPPLVPTDLKELLRPHPELVLGKLDNGLNYAILPAKTPAGRFEAHLEIHAGPTHSLLQHCRPLRCHSVSEQLPNEISGPACMWRIPATHPAACGRFRGMAR